jgi:drug/metabolite transporter (DMT)-like permease
MRVTSPLQVEVHRQQAKVEQSFLAGLYRNESRMKGGVSVAALIVVGVVLVFLGLFGGGVVVISLGVVCLFAAGLFEAVGCRRRRS